MPSDLRAFQLVDGEDAHILDASLALATRGSLVQGSTPLRAEVAGRSVCKLCVRHAYELECAMFHVFGGLPVMPVFTRSPFMEADFMDAFDVLKARTRTSWMQAWP